MYSLLCPPTMLNESEARKGRCSLYPNNKWAAKYRNVETDKQAYEDRSRLLQILHEAPLLPTDGDMNRFFKDYEAWSTKTCKLLRASGNYHYRHFQDPWSLQK